jgi:integrase
MAKVEGLNLRGSRWHVRIIVPDDLKDHYGKSRVNLALGTGDRKEAVHLATLKRAEWLSDFAAKRRERTASPVPEIPPNLSTLLADMVRQFVLSEDDRVRSDLPLLAEMVHIRRELDLKAVQPLRIPQWAPSAVREDDLTGATPEELQELADLNAYLDGKAAVAMAGGNLKIVLPLVQALAAKLGVSFDVKTPGAREALQQCLKAYRNAHREVTLRDAGEVVQTPVQAPERYVPAKPRTLRDVFDQWETSGEKPRTADTIQAYGRALKQFEAKYPAAALADITREMGNSYRTALRESSLASKTSKDRLNAIKSLLKFAADVLQWIPQQPWRGLNIEATTVDKRRPWGDKELTALFAAPLHTSYELPKGNQAGREAAYWLPLLGLFTGARLGELCQLQASDIRVVEDIPAIVLTDEGADQSIKTRAGKRTIPIHSELLRLGFLEYAQRIQGHGAGSLWPTLRLRKGKPSDYFGRWFKEYREGLGLPGVGGPTFHYFRHTVRPLMRRAGVSSAMQDKVTGHETLGSVGDVVYDHWQLKELVPAVEAIKFPHLRLPVVSSDAGRRARTGS